jgi:hypothetical protein
VQQLHRVWAFNNMLAQQYQQHGAATAWHARNNAARLALPARHAPRSGNKRHMAHRRAPPWRGKPCRQRGWV